MDTIAIRKNVERAVVVRVDSYELPYLALVAEAELHPDEDAEIQEIEIEAECWGYFVPGYTSGPPEDCYPDEGDFEIQEVSATESDLPVTLTDSEADEIEEAFWATEQDVEPDYPHDPPDDYPDYYEGGAYP